MDLKAACRCCQTANAALIARRQLLRSLAIAGIAVSLPVTARAAETDYDAMLLSCIDPRMIGPVHKYMANQSLAGKYSQFCIAGAAIAVVAPKFAAWRPAFWDNTAASFQLHRINRIIAINHRDCGAARIAYGAASIATPKAETATHERVFSEFRAAVAKHHPELSVVTGLMALDGSLEVFT